MDRSQTHSPKGQGVSVNHGAERLSPTWGTSTPVSSSGDCDPSWGLGLGAAGQFATGRLVLQPGGALGISLPMAVSAILRRHFLGAVCVPHTPFLWIMHTAQRPAQTGMAASARMQAQATQVLPSKPEHCLQVFEGKPRQGVCYSTISIGRLPSCLPSRCRTCILCTLEIENLYGTSLCATRLIMHDLELYCDVGTAGLVMHVPSL